MLAANCVIKEVRCFLVRPFVRSLFVGLFVCSYCAHDIAWRLICNIVQYRARDSTCLFGILTEQARVISCMRTRYCTTCARTISHVLVRYCGSTEQARAISCTIFISCARTIRTCLFGIADQPNKHVRYLACARDIARYLSCARCVWLIFSSAVRSGKVG